MAKSAQEAKSYMVDDDEFQDVFEVDYEPVEHGASRAIKNSPQGVNHRAGMSLKAASIHYKLASSTIRQKIKRGEIPAEKIQGTNGPEWRVYTSSSEFIHSEQQGAIQGANTVSPHCPSNDDVVQQSDLTAEPHHHNQQGAMQGAMQGANTVSPHCPPNDDVQQADPTSEPHHRNQQGTIHGAHTVSPHCPPNDDVQQSDPTAEPQLNRNDDELVRFLMARMEALTYRNGYLESQLKEREDDLVELKLLTDSQHKNGWWHRFCFWFLGRKPS